MHPITILSHKRNELESSEFVQGSIMGVKGSTGSILQITQFLSLPLKLYIKIY